VVVVVHRCEPAVVSRFFVSLHEALGDRWSGTLVIVENRPAETTSAAAREGARRFGAAKVVIVRSRRNLGFGAGVNVGVARTTASFVGIFNPDGTARAETVRLLVEALQRDPEAFIAGARLERFDGPVPVAPDAPDPAPVQEVDFVPGTAAVFRRERFLELGGFDPLYFMYLEDSDLCLRARQRWHLLHVPAAVFHHGRPSGRRPALRRARTWTVSANTFSYRWASTRRRGLADVAPKRARRLLQLGRERQWPQVAGATLGLLAWPVQLPRAEWRRRRPWNARSLERWLARMAPLLDETRVG